MMLHGRPFRGRKEAFFAHEGRKMLRCCLCRKAEAESLCSAFAKNVQRAPEGGRKKAAAAGRLFHLIEMTYLFLCFSEGGRR